MKKFDELATRTVLMRPEEVAEDELDPLTAAIVDAFLFAMSNPLAPIVLFAPLGIPPGDEG